MRTKPQESGLTETAGRNNIIWYDSLESKRERDEEDETRECRKAHGAELEVPCGF